MQSLVSFPIGVCSFLGGGGGGGGGGGVVSSPDPNVRKCYPLAV